MRRLKALCCISLTPKIETNRRNPCPHTSILFRERPLVTAPTGAIRIYTDGLLRCSARHGFQVLTGALVLTSSSSDSEVLLQRVLPARPQQVPRQQPPPGESRQAQAGKKKKCNREAGEPFFLVETVRNHHLGRAEHSGTTSAKHQAAGVSREGNGEKPKAVL